MKLVLVCLMLASCATGTDMAYVERRFEIFVSDCTLMQGHLYVPRKRVPNAPPTVWEMKDAVCWYDDGTYPRRILL